MSLDTKIAQFSRPKADAIGAPPVAGLGVGDAGLLAVNFAGHDAAEKLADKVGLYSWDGASWKHLNASAAITTQTLDLTTGAAVIAAADIGAAYAALSAAAKALTGSIVIATHGTPAGAFLLTDKTHPELAASWTSLGSATPVASSAEAQAGTDNLKMITSAALRAEITRLFGGTVPSTSAAGGTVADSGKVLLLGADGLLPVTALPVAAAADATAGTAVTSLLTPKALRDELVRVFGISAANALAGAVGINAGGGTTAGAGKIPLLDANGHIDASFLSINGFTFLPAADPTAAPVTPTGGLKSGSLVVFSAGGVPETGWGFPADVVNVELGDMALWDGTAWHHLATAADLSTAVLKAGANTMATDASLTWTDPGTADTVVIDGAVAANAVAQNLTLKACVIDCGDF